MLRLPIVALLLAMPAVPATAQTAPAAAPTPALRSGHTRAFLDPLGRLWEVPGRDGLDVWFAATDTNGDGKIDRNEILAEARSWFKMLDLNGDGVIDPDEETAYENDRTGGHGHGDAGVIVDDEPAGDTGGPPPPLLSGHRGGGGHGRHGHLGGGFAASGGGEDRTGALMDVSNPVVSADVNMDRGISLQEALNAAGTRLSRLDLDGDGMLSLTEARQRRDAQASTVRNRNNPGVSTDAGAGGGEGGPPQ